MAIARPASKKQHRIEELQRIILDRFPDARFQVTPAPDARGVTAIWTYSTADVEELSDTVRDREFEIMMTDGIHISVIPMPLEAYRG